jgi:tetratricopeptide (TPR) repeat protein
MARTHFASSAVLLALTAGISPSQTTTPAYTPGEYQSANPNYPIPNPFYFEGKVDWGRLKIDQPANTWDYMQRGIHRQDDLEDIPGALEDYQTSYSMNNLANGTCQLVTSASLVNGALPSRLTPPPCMFTVRMRWAYLLRDTEPDHAIALLQEVLQIDPLRLDVNALIGEIYTGEAEHATTDQDRVAAYGNAVQAFQAELALSPVTAQLTALTGDEANNAHAHWALAEIYEQLGQTSKEMSELDAYLKATKWHSDVYPWRIDVAKKKMLQLQGPGDAK